MCICYMTADMCCGLHLASRFKLQCLYLGNSINLQSGISTNRESRYGHVHLGVVLGGGGGGEGGARVLCKENSYVIV